MCFSCRSLWICSAWFHWFRYFFCKINCDLVILESYDNPGRSSLRIVVRIFEKKIVVNTLLSFDGIDDHWFGSRDLSVRRWGIWSVRYWFSTAKVHFIKAIHRHEYELIFFEFNWTSAKCTRHCAQGIEFSGWSINFSWSINWCDCHADKCYSSYHDF